MAATRFEIRRAPDGTILGFYDERGVFLTRQQMKAIAQDIEMFCSCISDREIETNVTTTLQHYQQKQIERRSKAGYIYLFESYDGFYKIGQAKNPSMRIKEITMPYRPKLIHKMPVSDMDWAEKYLHNKFAHRRVDGEWFNLSSQDVFWIMSRKTLQYDQTELSLEEAA